jgi:hypothetical protein
MLNKTLLTIAALAIFMVVPTFGAPATGCNKIKFTGSYVRTATVFPLQDGSVQHSTLFQLNLNADGTAVQNWTGFLDYAINTGAGSLYFGSWTCRADGKLIVTLISAGYAPVPAGSNPEVTSQDISLALHSRNTYLYSVDDTNTLTRLAARTRSYAPDQDATDPAGGSLGSINNSTVVFKRLVATDDDLLVP